jgi:very-short-patch-repair endonuclease
MDTAATTSGDNEGSIFQSNLSVEAKIEKARTELLDLSARNRLLNVPRFSKSAKTIDIVDEKSSEIFRILVNDGKTMTFLAGAKGRDPKDGTDGDELIELALPDDDERDADGRLVRHGDTKLQTRMTPNALQKRLMDLYFDARTLEEEQGVNILFLGLGMLKWIDPSNAENVRHAPLILVPVSLERGSAAERFKLRARQEEFASNLSLEAFLDRVHKISMPAFEASDDFSFEEYAAKVATCISIKPNWSVQPDEIVLGFFSFAKFLMYRDLDPNLWPKDGKFTDRPLVTGLVSNGFEGVEGLLGEDANIDAHISPVEMTHIVDADSSQTAAIHEVRRGRDLVIQGPPGTGKSQTIANIIASAVADGKTVLFVAEKMAALEVVKRRLDQAGIGEACLELHSNKANKRVVLAELQHTWELGVPKGESGASLTQRLTDARDLLNAHPARIHRLHEPYSLSPFQVMGHLARLRRQGMAPSDIELPAASQWTPEARDRAKALLVELAERINDIGLPLHHPWHGVELTGITPLDLERLTTRLATSATELAELRSQMEEAARILECASPQSLGNFTEISRMADRVASCPSEISSLALADDAWTTDLDRVRGLISGGAEFSKQAAEVSRFMTTSAWDVDPDPVAAQFGRLPVEFPQSGFRTIEQLASVLPRFLSAAGALRTILGVNASATLSSIDRLIVIGQRVAEAPDASPDAFVAAIWERGLDQASDLAEAVSELRRIRGDLDGKISDLAWDTDLLQVRTAVAVHGKRFLKFMSSDWRKAKTLLRTLMPSEMQPDDTLRILDLLQKGKEARTTVKEGDGLGRSAFGADWRGEKSDPKPLENLVLWMRSLRGVGAEARQIASRLSDKGAVGARCEQVRALHDETRRLLLNLWADLGETALTVFTDAPGPETALLTQVSQFMRELSDADSTFTPLVQTIPETNGSRLVILKLLTFARVLKAKLESLDSLGRAAFGTLWKGSESNWTQLSDVTDWIGQNMDIRVLTSRVVDRSAVATQSRNVLAKREVLLHDLEALVAFLKADTAIVFGTRQLSEAQLSVIAQKLSQWIETEEQLSKWAAYRGRAEDATKAGVGLVVERLEDGRVGSDEVVPYVEMAIYEAILRHQHSAAPELARFDGEVHGRLVNEFATLDRSRMSLSRLDVVKAHHKRIPPISGIGPVGVLRAEMARRRGHMPIRQLMQRASVAMQALKPVFMMSPLSVAQFLPPGLLQFDLLVMDEASQIQPVDALGAVARAKQVVVVGDERQLPPTQFFSKMTSATTDDGDDGQGGAQVSDIESILGLFSARGLPQKMLRWHYRSRHQSLIAVSNSQFYESKLFIVPSPYTAEAGMGLSYHHVPGGVFEDGANKIEAKVVAEAIIRHALESPNLSLGVAAFSIKQRREIQDQLELLRRLNAETEEFFHAHPSEPFFIKNLENVQGDERDVILISVAYSGGPGGAPMSMRFGPLGAEGGERRLNVLISRAKRRCEVYASITDEDIDLERGKGKGVFAFKLFLHYARTGRLSMTQRTDRGVYSVFEEQVMAALQEKGYQVHPQVGIAGFFIDLAVADEQIPGKYILGIECDGAAYHESRSARDRDRLRQAVLEDHGWNIYRIWSTDWFQRPKAELERLVTAIESAKSEARLGAAELQAKRAVPVDVVTIERSNVTEIGLQPIADQEVSNSNSYNEAVLRPNVVGELHEAPIGTVAALVKQTVQAEGPIHRDEVVTRIRTAWGLQRAGNRIDSHVGMAIAIAQSSRDIIREGEFLLWPESEVVLRDRSGVASLGLRRIEMLPPTEIDAGLISIIRTSLGATADQAVNAVARGLGFKATSSQLKDLVETRIAGLQAKGLLSESEGMLTVVEDR